MTTTPRAPGALHALVLEYEHPPDLGIYREHLADVSGLVLATAATPADARAHAPRAQVLVAKAHDVTADLVSCMPQLRMVQALTTGTDALARAGLPRGTVIASARGVHGPQMAELAFLMMLSLARDAPRLHRNQQAHRWERWPQPLLCGRTVTVLGVGLIAEAFAARAAAFGMRVTGVSGRASAPGFDAIFPRGALHDAVAEAEFVLVLAPYTPATHHMVDAGVLDAMRPQACLINLARGGVVDEPALVEALRNRRIAGAGLDVFASEPLAVESPLWDLPNVLITPHVGGMSDRYAQSVAPLVAANLRAFAEGRLADLQNRVDLAAS